jgi:prepilin-type N-terminal cleavage/methylation domain-containing protein
MEIKMKNEIANVTLSAKHKRSRIKNEIAALNCARNDRRTGFTLIEVVLAIVVITIAVSATLVVMAKMMNYTANRGQAVDISNAVTISQMVIDRVRDQQFPPTGTSGNLSGTSDTSITISNITYTYKTEIVASDNAGSDSPINTISEYPATATGSDSMLGYRNLLKVTVTVFKAGKAILKTVTYKTRNGYY